MANALQGWVHEAAAKFGESNPLRCTIVKWAATGSAFTQRTLTPFGSLHANQENLGITSDNGKTSADVQMQSSWQHFMERSLKHAINKALAAGERVFVAPTVLLAGGTDGQATYNSGGGVNYDRPGTAPSITTATAAADRAGVNALVTVKAIGPALGTPPVGCVFVPPPTIFTPDPGANGFNFERIDRVNDMLMENFITAYPQIEVVNTNRFEVREDNIHMTGKGDFELGAQIVSQLKRMFAYEVPATLAFA